MADLEAQRVGAPVARRGEFVGAEVLARGDARRAVAPGRGQQSDHVEPAGDPGVAVAEQLRAVDGDAGRRCGAGHGRAGIGHEQRRAGERAGQGDGADAQAATDPRPGAPRGPATLLLLRTISPSQGRIRGAVATGDGGSHRS